MCDPVTIGAIGLGVGAIGSGASAYGSYKSGQEAGNAADENARLVRRQAQLQAAEITRVGQAESGAARMEGTKVIAEQKTAIAAAGVDPSVGSAADVAGQSRANSELDAATIRNNAAREAWGLKTEANAQARELRKQGAQAREAGTLAAVGGILGGIAGTAQGVHQSFGKRG